MARHISLLLKKKKGKRNPTKTTVPSQISENLAEQAVVECL